MPGRANRAYTSLVPMLHFSRLLDDIRVFDQQHQTDFSPIRLTDPMGAPAAENVIEIGPRADDLEVMRGVTPSLIDRQLRFGDRECLLRCADPGSPGNASEAGVAVMVAMITATPASSHSGRPSMQVPFGPGASAPASAARVSQAERR